MKAKNHQSDKIMAYLTFHKWLVLVYNIQNDIWMLQTKTSHLWKMSYAIILLADEIKNLVTKELYYTCVSKCRQFEEQIYLKIRKCRSWIVLLFHVEQINFFFLLLFFSFRNNNLKQLCGHPPQGKYQHVATFNHITVWLYERLFTPMVRCSSLFLSLTHTHTSSRWIIFLPTTIIIIIYLCWQHAGRPCLTDITDTRYDTGKPDGRMCKHVLLIGTRTC